MSTYLYFKETNSDLVVAAELGTLLQPTEQVMNVQLNDVTPITDIPLLASVVSVDLASFKVSLSRGTTGTSYGVEAVVTTNLRVFAVLLAITVNTLVNELVPYSTSNPDAFKDLIGEIAAGETAVGTAVFVFPPNTDPSGGYVTWELLAEEDTVYAAGNAFEYNIRSTGLSNSVFARSVVSVPSDIPPTLEQQKYQLRWTLHLDGYPDQFQYESITVVGLNTVPLGTQPSVELQGNPATLELVTPELYDQVGIELFHQNSVVVPFSLIYDNMVPGSPSPERVASGWYYNGVIDTTQLQVSVEPYTAVWKYWQSEASHKVYTERADFWVINPSIMGAIDDVKAKINKAMTTLYGTPDLLFPISTVLTWLRRGMDAFNGYQGNFTQFTMTNALGSIREWWLLLAEQAALEAQYIAEGEKAFDFQGAAIQLNVDKTQYLADAISRIQSRIDSELKPFKQNLIIKGNIRGDGSQDPSRLQRGAMGTVGICFTPASQWNRFSRGYFRDR